MIIVVMVIKIVVMVINKIFILCLLINLKFIWTNLNLRNDTNNSDKFNLMMEETSYDFRIIKKKSELNGKTMRKRCNDGNLFSKIHQINLEQINVTLEKKCPSIQIPIPKDLFPRCMARIFPYLDNTMRYQADNAIKNHWKYLEANCWSEIEHWSINMPNLSVIKYSDKYFKKFQCSIIQQFLSINDLISLDQVLYSIDWKLALQENLIKNHAHNYLSARINSYQDLYPNVFDISNWLKIYNKNHEQTRLIWKCAAVYFNRLSANPFILNINLTNFSFQNNDTQIIDCDPQMNGTDITISYQPENTNFTQPYVLEKYNCQHSPKYRKSHRCKKFKGNKKIANKFKGFENRPIEQT